MTTPNERAADALRRLAPAVRFLSRTCRRLAAVGAVAGTIVWAVLAARHAPEWPWGTAVAVVALAALAAAPLWLRHAAETLEDLTRLPDRIDTRPQLTAASRAGLRELRSIGGAVRTIRTTVTEYGDYVAPGLAVVEVAAPLFWVLTLAATVATAIAAALVPVAGLVALLALLR